MILTIKTDVEMAEIALFEVSNIKIDLYTWQAHRELSDTLLLKIEEMIRRNERNWSDLTGIIVFAGPGSFTGLRIGVSAANAVSYSLGIPIVSTKTDGWIIDGLQRLANSENETIVTPYYGAEANVSKPKK